METAFFRLAKIDEPKRRITGIAAGEVLDRSREIMDYATAVPAFQEWSGRFEAATGGLSKGNVREMHNPRLCAGKLEGIRFDDLNKTVEIDCKIVDEGAWQKALQGVYTGFSIGGGYAKKWADSLHKGATRYTPRISEISLVDAPCMPIAVFAQLAKADGMTAEIALRGRAHTYGELKAAQAAMVPALTYAQLRPAPTYAELKARAGR